MVDDFDAEQRSVALQEPARHVNGQPAARDDDEQRRQRRARLRGSDAVEQL
jgi:hypothetical protein